MAMMQLFIRYLFLVAFASGLAAMSNVDNPERTSIRLMFYNVENLFDTEDDPETDDDEFLAGGTMGWNQSRYNQKLKSIYKAIVASGDGDLPAVCGLVEVENRRVVEELLSLTPLNQNLNFEIIHEESDDRRGIDVCLIYRSDILDLAEFNFYFPDDLRKAEFRSRSVLYTKWIWDGSTFHLFLNHWPSRRGGVAATEDTRKSFALMVRNLADSIRKVEGSCARIIIAGDLNYNPGGPEDDILTGLSSGPYINLMSQPSAKGLGTYKYNGVWETPDQVLVTRSLMEDCDGQNIRCSEVKVPSLPALLVRDKRFPGYRPFSTWYGRRYQGGFSDHLPVVIDLHRPAGH